ncbi:MAG: WD40/YVTN/BNR-like repeat-containing protein [Paludibacter sp.]
MKTIYLKIISFLWLLSLIGCTNNSDFDNSITITKVFENATPTDISFANKDVGFISGGFEVNTGTAVIAKTIDGGNTWKVIPVYINKSSSSIIRTIYAKSSDSVYATYNTRDDRCGVCFSKDGGKNWSSLGNFQCGSAYSGINFKTSKIGYVCWTGDILQTTNGGSNWETVFNYDGFGGVGQLFFTSYNVGYAYGGFAVDHGSFGTLLKTVDGGNTWIEINSLAEFVTCLSFIDDNVGYAFTYNNNVYKTTNGGATWELLKNINDLAGSYYAIAIKNKIKYFGSGFSIFKTSNDFKTIETIYKDTLNDISLSIKAVQPSDKSIFILSTKQSIFKITL